MQKASEFLGRVIRRLDHPDGAQAWLESSWPRVVGTTLAAHTRPLRCTSGCLEISTDGKAWRNQMEIMKEDFCARINQSWGGNLIRDVKFVVRTRDTQRISREADNEHTPFVRRRRT